MKSGFLIFLITMLPSAAALDDWDRFEKAVRDQQLSKEDAKNKFPALMNAIFSYAKQFPFSYQERWIFPVHGYSIKDVGKGGFQPAIRYGSSPMKGYDFYDGNVHGGHPAYDIFIHDENRDCLDDRTAMPCAVAAPEDMLILSCCTVWEKGSLLRGGKYLWGLNIVNHRLLYFAHLDSVAAHSGDFCKAGTIIGAVGRTGKNASSRRSPTHLHLMALDINNEQLRPIDIWEHLNAPH